MKKDKTEIKKDFLSTLSSMTPEEVTELIFKNSKVKTLKNVIVRINK